MPRASEYLLEGYTYHLTHRCHNREFLLRFAKDRTLYREWLLKAVHLFKVPLFGYCITTNHVHILLHAESTEAVSNLMHLTAGSTAKQFNLRKDHVGSLWEHPYQCTVVEDRTHLLNCLTYVNLNMVRAGVVTHPDEWRWCGHDEMMGTRKRYRILDLERLSAHLDYPSVEDLRTYYLDRLNNRLQSGGGREPFWTETLAVGSLEFVNQMKSRYASRTRFNTTENQTVTPPVWMLRESTSLYGGDPSAS